MSVRLVSREGVRIVVDTEAASLSSFMKMRMEGGEAEIHLPDVDTAVLEKAVEFCIHHIEDPMRAIRAPLVSHEIASVVQEWYANFACRMDPTMLNLLVVAAYHLDIDPLQKLLCFRIASLIKDKSGEEVVDFFQSSGVTLTEAQRRDVEA